MASFVTPLVSPAPGCLSKRGSGTLPFPREKRAWDLARGVLSASVEVGDARDAIGRRK